MLAISRNAVSSIKLASRLSSFRSLTTPATDKEKFKVLVVGGGPFIRFFGLSFLSYFHLAGSGGLSVAHQIYDRFRAAGKPLGEGDVAIVDAAEYHYYQVRPCQKEVFSRPQTHLTNPGASLGGKSYLIHFRPVV